MGDSIFGVVVIAIMIVFFVARSRRKKKKNTLKETRWREEKRSTITDANVKEEWKSMLEQAGGHGEQLMESVAHRIQNDNIPNVSVSRREMSLEGAVETRPFVVVSNSNKMNQAYKVVFNATDYGNRLSVAWYLLFDITELAEGAMYGKSMAEKQELTNYVGVVHRLIMNEVKQMMNNLKLDFTKVDTHTKGFLNLS